MRSTILFALLCATVLELSAVTASASPKQYLRSRILAKTTVPFSIRLNLAVSKDDKGPKASDYAEAEAAVTSWFDDQSKMYFGAINSNSTAVQRQGVGAIYLSTVCGLDRNGTFWDPANIDMPHTISLKCSSDFEGDSMDIPSSVQLMITASERYSYKLFVEDYLLPTLSDNSVFQNTNRVSIGMTGQAAIIDGMSHADNDFLDDDEAMMTPGENETDSGAAPSMTHSPASGDVSIVPAILEWTIGKPATPGVAPTQPTDAEYEEFLALSHSFVTATLEAAFASPETPALLGGESSFRSKDYNPAADAPYTMVIVTDLSFNSTTPPDMWQWVGALRLAGLEDFRADYLPDSGPFMLPSTMQWLALDN